MWNDEVRYKSIILSPFGMRKCFLLKVLSKGLTLQVYLKHGTMLEGIKMFWSELLNFDWTFDTAYIF